MPVDRFSLSKGSGCGAPDRMYQVTRRGQSTYITAVHILQLLPINTKSLDEKWSLDGCQCLRLLVVSNLKISKIFAVFF